MKTETFIKQIIIDGIAELRTEDNYGCDLINRIFDNDYYMIGTYQCSKWLEKNGGVFNAIDVVKNYENDNYGEVYTDFSDAEKLCNIYIYILTQEMLGDTEHIRTVWDKILTEEDYDLILEELK